MKRRVFAFVCFVMLLLGLRFWPHASLQARVPVSTGVWSADGELLRVRQGEE